MAVPKFILECEGSWRGTSRLHLSWLEDESTRIRTSPSTLELIAAGSIAWLTYDWVYEGEPHRGAMLIAGAEDGECSVGWSDTWHQNEAVMRLAGPFGNQIRVTGEYGVTEGPPNEQAPWKWRIELFREGDRLRLLMTNIAPDGPPYLGAEAWAVDAIYERV